ncbi:MAG: lysine/arginine/ornithine ABC transporter substrate-binding protein [Inhella sp.]|jgi:arginine/ornithine transport system substrate-binding protein|uniref:lysine/arginine/ornithine ABC transporter substrate-binding protein n=1 Tax=Inhella sp. TaxID=1921806 RepID=UPI0022BBD60C|nr:lysine/arginine/ornithine ABC transporter substrate-binding protein [Inhella sp.]MCZ8236449.1 lysine/arginine/ornithine ABC transporter substrate-binding protein [Inhella sp.]
MIRRSLAALAAVALAVAVLPAAAQSKKLRIGVEGAYPPFSEVDAKGELKGFEIDLARAWCVQMKRECELVKTDFDGLIPALQARKIDAIVASMSITDERKKAIAFSKAYLASPAIFVAKSGTKGDVSPAALKGKKIGVQSATTFETYIAAAYKDSTVVRYQTQDQIYLELKAGRVDYTLVDKYAVDSFLKSDAGKGMAFIGPDIDDEKYFGIGIGVGLRKADEKTLGAALNAAIDAVNASGEYKKLSSKYFAYDVAPKKK